MATAIRKIVTFLRRESFRENSDQALIEAFAQRNDESAFSELVRRHGPFVFGVCQRVLGNVADAEDAFQATFLVLARKAPSISWRESIKGWLHSVAVRIAMKARVQSARRRKKEVEAAIHQQAVHDPAECWSGVRAILDEELDRLPAKCRAVLLLCYLEGKTRDEAAEKLGWSPGSVKGYLERGRNLLRARLAGRGLPLSA